MIDTISTQLARSVRIQERLRDQVCDGDLPRHARQAAEQLHDQTNRIREDIQKLYHTAQACV